MTTVVIVDDHPVYRQGLALVVEEDEDLTLVGQAKSIEHFDEQNLAADVVLLDLHLPASRELKGSRMSAARVIGSSSFPRPAPRMT